ncbi:hypothetical protein M409DRAFT_62222 [Zasmidium cellare ATCC 36951]|uniref:Major facilitator superfamily (MFS) profile domain-containing protein n=1 Tax=Zasmidium cellare ATCC 36951 TaxID=1080233 RepID=A0A6A6D6K5_ZASCE|nr:uncharacterized protein M409DRAFT_62222 [Zasmidium cellare ATCC 36951]KAF2174058.1 hypothetical protein M409DRAFT_62222 [Zasmidium cellare ATCC 36951]
MTNHTDDIVPGTVHLINVAGQTLEGQHGVHGSDIVLVPQPSKDPEDPLNWSQRRKFWALTMAIVYTFGVSIPQTMHFSVIADITRDTGISTADLVQGNGLMFLFLGWGCLFWQPIAMAYGRRGVYMASTLICTPIMVWTAYSSTAGEWYAHRILIGCANAAIESLPEISIADLFFAHDRDTWMAVYVLVLFASSFVSPIIAGWFDVAYGWRWTMFLGAMISALAFFILLFGMEETTYYRHSIEGEGFQNPSRSMTSTGSNDDKKPEKAQMVPISSIEHDASTTSPYPKPRTYLQKLKPFMRLSGRPTPKQVLWMMWRPLPIILQFPNIAWSGFIYGINLSWYNVLNGTTSPVLSAPPYNWSAALIGCIYVGPIIGSILGCLWSGWLADKWVLRLARRNGGIREPEQRLWPLAIAGVFTCAGLILWGVGAAHGIHWLGLAFGLGMLTFGLIVGGSIGLSYAVDCFKEISGESMASVIIIRNTMGFGFSYAITPWYTDVGLQDCFLTAGFVSLACMMTFLGMVWKGKALRRWSARAYWRYVESSLVASH